MADQIDAYVKKHGKLTLLLAWGISNVDYAILANGQTPMLKMLIKVVKAYLAKANDRRIPGKIDKYFKRSDVRRNEEELSHAGQEDEGLIYEEPINEELIGKELMDDDEIYGETRDYEDSDGEESDYFGSDEEDRDYADVDSEYCDSDEEGQDFADLDGEDSA
ncbi:MAG: hypothetical protein LQ340_001465 [Diploschistes diacapsis]|nr:MAG: hypothetical protein LQ340_001465 [Diploschistes diacapsis]